MKYDDASWHSDGDFPADLSPDAGATHIGMFVVWAFLSGLASDDVSSDDLQPIKSRTQTPGEFFLSHCDGKFVDSDLNDVGNAFATDYFLEEKPQHGKYIDDYTSVTGFAIELVYYIPDTWETLDTLKPRLNERFKNWCSTRDS